MKSEDKNLTLPPHLLPNPSVSLSKDPLQNLSAEKVADAAPVPPTTQEIVEHFVGPVKWSGLEGFCKCPGEHLHTHATKRNDCKVYISSVPTLTCFHDHCHEAVAETNREIRTVWSLYQPEPDAATLKAVKEKAAKKYMLIDKARASKPVILEKYAWPVAEMIAQNPDRVKGAADYGPWDWQRFLSLYDDNDVLWIGEPDSTGKAIYAARWRRVAEWRYLPGPEYPFTCPSVFKRGIWSRSNENVVHTPYLVVECDNILGVPVTVEEKAANKDACGAIFRWMREAVGMELQMVVDSGNKSLHGWFKMPGEELLDELKVVLPELGVDRISFKPAQPMRCPGAVRTLKDGRAAIQNILWFKEVK